MGSNEDDDGWHWVLSPRADDQFGQLETDSQQRIAEKLDEVIASEWRDPDDFLDPVTGSPYQKLRVGDYRLGCRVRDEENVLRVESIRKREGAYKADD